MINTTVTCARACVRVYVCVYMCYINRYGISYISASYLLVVLVLSLLSVSLTVWNVKFHSLEDEPPRTVKKIFASLRSVLFCERRRVPSHPDLRGCRNGSVIKIQPVTDSEMDVTRDSRDSNDDDIRHGEITWKDVSETLDRIYFFLFLLAFVILNATLLISLTSEHISPWT